jgi:hypothetical protein
VIDVANSFSLVANSFSFIGGFLPTLTRDARSKGDGRARNDSDDRSQRGNVVTVTIRDPENWQELNVSVHSNNNVMIEDSC